MGRGGSDTLDGIGSADEAKARDLHIAYAQLSGISDAPNGHEIKERILSEAYEEARTIGDANLGDLVARTVSALGGQLYTHPGEGMHQVEDIVVDLLGNVPPADSY